MYLGSLPAVILPPDPETVCSSPLRENPTNAVAGIEEYDDVGPLFRFVEVIHFGYDRVLSGAIDHEVDSLLNSVAVINSDNESISRPASIWFLPSRWCSPYQQVIQLVLTRRRTKSFWCKGSRVTK